VGPEDRYLWPDAQMYYEIDESFDDTDKANLQAAIDDFHKKTCLRWIPRTNQTAYVWFYRNRNGTACAHSFPQCYGPKQVVHLGFERCARTDNMIHEMGHAACLGHEHDRNDKDNYITDCGNEKYDNLNGGHLYDYRSVMHYRFPECLVPKMSGVSGYQCRSTNGLSVLDAEKLNDMYKCGGERICVYNNIYGHESKQFE
jgi:hypothetical protein